MKKFVRYTLYTLGGIAVVVGGMAAYVRTALPNVGAAPEITVEITPERVERGRYLAWHVMMCMDCHSQRDWSLFSGPPTPGTAGAGGEVFDHHVGFPGRFLSRNITPTGLNDWTDGEIYRAITMGVKRDGDPIFPVMPWANYGRMADEDIHAVIAYVRTLEPVPGQEEPGSADFPMNLIMRTMPAKNTPGTRPDRLTDPVAYGEYVLNAAACVDCHTRFENGAFTGPPLAGGREFHLPGGLLRTPNITSHPTGIGGWSREQFIARFKQHDPDRQPPAELGPGDMQTLMPWAMYAGMSEEDLGAMYDYLRTTAPVDNPVVRFVPRP